MVGQLCGYIVLLFAKGQVKVFDFNVHGAVKALLVQLGVLLVGHLGGCGRLQFYRHGNHPMFVHLLPLLLFLLQLGLRLPQLLRVYFLEE